jgi:Fe2+ or Zn2+ uptake regulation protein
VYHFHETIPDLKTLDVYEAKAAKQDQIILDFFKTWPGATFTAPEVWEKIKWQNKPPLTSVRRALTNLQKMNWIEKVSKRDGLYGRDNYAYRLR